MKPLVRLPGITMNKVSELFALGSRTWDVDLVRNSFISLDFDEILKIQPSRTMNDDVLAWAHERNGHYLVRLAYRFLKQEEGRRLQEIDGGGGTSVPGRWWGVLRKLKVPPKIRIFWWRVISGLIFCHPKGC